MNFVCIKLQSLFAACLALALALAPPRHAGAQPPEPPPGVRETAVPAVGDLPRGMRAACLEVDWTHPLLRSELVNGLHGGDSPDPTTPPLSWRAAERQDPHALRIQLIEPEETADGAWRAALPWSAGATSGALPDAAPYLVLGARCPWLLAGPPVRALPGINPEPAGSVARLGVRWLGRRADLDAMPELPYRDRLLISLTEYAAGRTRLVMLTPEAGGVATLDELRPWLGAALGPAEWLAVHSAGPLAIVGQGDWRLGTPGDPRREPRLGVALTLRALEPGGLVDWARMTGARISASSQERDFPVGRAIEGLLWPAPFDFAGWISREEPEGAAPWLQIDFTPPRPISRVVIRWASAGGWSAAFNPGRASLLAAASDRAELRPVRTFDVPGGPESVIEWPGPTDLGRLRLDFEAPSRMAGDARARVAAVQAWGPWDGAAAPRPTPESNPN